MYAAIETERNGTNLGFLRPGSGVHVIVVSDAVDTSSRSPEALARWLDELRPIGDQVTFSSISLPGSAYEVVTDAVGGLSWPVLDLDDRGLFGELGAQASALTREFFLSERPVPGSIDLKVEAREVTFIFREGQDWTYDAVRNSVRFLDYLPSATAEVVINYDPLGH